MSGFNDLDLRMKENYEFPYRVKLTKRIPVIVRLDGKAFHTFTKSLDKPFDDILISAFQETCLRLCEDIQGCQIAYHQSDEISLLIVDYQSLESQAYFDYNVQKMASIIASSATLYFNRAFENIFKHRGFVDEPGRYEKAIETGAKFDCRVFNIPKEEVTNYFYSRQLDCYRNAIRMIGYANFKDKELHKKTTSDIIEMLSDNGIELTDFSHNRLYGSCAIKEKYSSSPLCNDKECIRTRWVIDHNIPRFIRENRKYIDKLVYIGE